MKRIISFLVIITLFFVVFGCSSKIEEQNNDKPVEIPDENPENNETDKDPNDDETENEDGYEFGVRLLHNKKPINLEGQSIKAIWYNEFSQFSKELYSNGEAVIKLDGEFNVYLSDLPDGYVYNPNIYKVDNENSFIDIELYKAIKTSKGNGTKLYYEYEVNSEGYYRTQINSKDHKVFYEFAPKKAGYYIIESVENVYLDNVNPKIWTYDGTAHWKNERPTKYDDGGLSLNGGFTKNFKWVVKLSEDALSSVFTFAILADTKNGSYPVDVSFEIKYAGEYYYESTVSKIIKANEADFKTKEYSKNEYVYYNSDGGTGNYYGKVANGTGLLVGENYKYNEEDGFWYYVDPTTQEEYILCAKIAAPCAYYEEALNMIESHGNKNLTVSNGTENYKEFIEVSYTLACNSDGVCYVTMELMEFLQKFSVSQRLFFDGNGFVESTGVYAEENDQWLFACGYYKPL
ncbi:MAG: hypothetical protein IJO27_04965 [Bacilli bacterium]|nr:hypothetical protein [Bacilli bacterium]